MLDLHCNLMAFIIAELRVSFATVMLDLDKGGTISSASFSPNARVVLNRVQPKVS